MAQREKIEKIMIFRGKFSKPKPKMADPTVATKNCQVPTQGKNFDRDPPLVLRLSKQRDQAILVSGDTIFRLLFK